MLKSEPAKSADVVSGRAVRRTPLRLGFRWTRPKYVLGRTDPDHESKKGSDPSGKRGARRGRGGVVGDETSLRGFPPLRAAWSRIGQQAEVIISGRNARWKVVGFLNVLTAKLVHTVRQQGRGEDIAAAQSGRWEMPR